MGRKQITIALTFLTVLFVAVMWRLMDGGELGILDPKGQIAAKQAELLAVVTILILVIVIPVFFLTFFIAWKYRADNKKAEYRPDWDGDNRLEALWWGIPFIIVGVLSALIWTSSHALSPYEPLDSEKEPLKVQVVALQWKWLFLYPEQNIATVNFLQAPVDRPIRFYITSDAPMNSFWIPQLGSQIYAMNGMVAQLNLAGDETGDYRGLSTNLSGDGFSKMDFTARISTQAEFEKWVQEAKNSPKKLSMASYEKLSRPGINASPVYYSAYQKNLYNMIVMKYMKTEAEMENMKSTMKPMSEMNNMEGGM